MDLPQIFVKTLKTCRGLPEGCPFELMRRVIELLHVLVLNGRARSRLKVVTISLADHPDLPRALLRSPPEWSPSHTIIRAA